MSADTQPHKTMEEKGTAPIDEHPLDLPQLDQLPKGRWERAWPTIACGAGLFSDGYLNGVCVLHPRYTAWRIQFFPQIAPCPMSTL
jgi:hypothetical protein